MQITPINKRIEGTNLYLFSRDSQTGDFTYSRLMNLDEATTIAGKVDGLKIVNNSLAYMSTLRGIQANRELMNQTQGKVWFPTIEEGFALHDAQLLPSGELMNFGITLYNKENPNKQIAEKLFLYAWGRDYQLPILASFKSLDLEQGGKKYGVTPIFVSQDGLISGKDTKKFYKRFTYEGIAGVLGIGHDWDGWCANWDDNLAGTNEDDRMRRVSAVDNAKNIKELAEAQINQHDQNAINELEVKLQEILYPQI